MVAINGTTETTVIKAKFLGDIRKTAIRHSHDVTFNDLVLMLQRIFAIDPALPVQLKYRDTDGDFVSLFDDNDVILALQTEQSLFVEISVTSEASVDLQEAQKHLECIQSCIEKLSVSLVRASSGAARLNSARGGDAAEHEHAAKSFTNTKQSSSSEYTASSVSALSPHNAAPPATIQPSQHQVAAPVEYTSPSLEEEINLGGEVSHESIPSFPQAQAPPPPPSHEPSPAPQQPHYTPSIPSVPPTPQPAYHPVPPSTTAPPPSAPPTHYSPPPPQQYAPPPQQQQYAPPPPSQVPQAPQATYPPPPSAYPPQQPPTSIAPPPPPSSFTSAPSFPPSQQYGAPPSTYQQQGYSSQQPPHAPPSAFPGAPPPSNFPGAPPPSNFPGAPPSGFPGAPPSFPPSQMGPPPLGGAAGGANPFARPPTDYRQSPYHQ